MKRTTGTWQALLHRAVMDARVLGSVFIVVGALMLIPLLMRTDGLLEQLLAVSASVLLIAPGVLYWVAAAALSARRRSGAVLARRAAGAHVLAIVAALLLGLSVGGFRRMEGAFFAPAVVALFFLPALIAFLVQTRAAHRAAENLDDAGRAFEPLPLARPASPSPASPEPPRE